MEKVLSIIAAIIAGGLTIFFLIVLPIFNGVKDARNWRRFKQYREDHNLPFYGEMEEETEKDLWDVY